MEENREKLVRVLSRGDVLALAFGSMIGWGWVMLAGEWVHKGGVLGAILAFLFGTILCIFVGLTYAELTPALPLAGGEMVFSYRGLGYNCSWITAWAICLAYLGVAAWEGIAISTAIDYLFPLKKMGFLWNVASYDVYFSWSIVGIIFAIILTILNLVGIKPSAVFQVSATIGLAIVGLAFFFGGVAFGNTKNLTPLWVSGTGMVSVMLMAPSMFVGFDVIPQSAEEMNIPFKTIGKILVFSVFLAAAWYILMILGISLSAPEEVRIAAKVPVADSMAYAYKSPIAGKILILGGICGILTSWNGFFIGATRVLFAMGRAKMLPAIFGKVHPKHRTPVYSVILVGIICSLSPLLGKNALVWFVDAASFGTVVAYFMVALSFLALRQKEPELQRPFKISNGKLVGIIAVIVAAGFIILYLPIGPGSLIWPQEWLMVLGWCLLGLILRIWANASFGKITDDEREYLVFGQEYSRKSYNVQQFTSSKNI